MTTILFDCYHDRNEVRLVVQKLLDEGLNHAQIHIIAPEVAGRLASRIASNRTSGNQRRRAYMQRTAGITATDHYRDSVGRRSAAAATRAVGLADPLARALARAGLSVDDALLGAAQSRQGATLVLIRS